MRRSGRVSVLYLAVILTAAGGTLAMEEGATKQTAAAEAIPCIRGVVRDANAAAAADVQIRVLPGDRQGTTSDVEGRFEVTWDRPGWLRSDAVAYLVARHVQCNLAAVVEIDEHTTAFDVKLAPGIAITGRVADPNGKAIAGARVTLSLRTSNWIWAWSPDEVQTDSTGSFEVRAVPTEHRYDLHVEAEGYGGKSRDGLDARAAVQGRLDTGVWTLLPGTLSVSGRVVDAQNHPATNASLHVYGDGQPSGVSARTDAKGRFTLPGVCPGRVNIEVVARRGVTELRAMIFTEGGAADIKIIVRESGHVLIQRISSRSYEQTLASDPKVIAGVAVDEKGSPVADVPVSIRCHKTTREGEPTWTFSDFREFGTTTDSQGRFALEPKEDGEYLLWFSPDHQAALIVYDVPAGQKDLKVTLPEGGTVTGRLLRIQKGRKIVVPKAEIKVEQTSRWSFSHLGFDRDRKTVTDAEGRFRIEHLATQIRADEAQAGFVPRPWKISCGSASQTIVFNADGTTQDVELIARPDLADAPPRTGNPLPGFDGIALDLAPEQTRSKRVLVCFFDWEQRPSRNCLLQLARQASGLQEKGVAIVGVHVTGDNQADLRKWIADSKIPFPVGVIEGDREEVLFTWSAKSLPWLVLTDATHVITAEGFTLSALDEKLGADTEKETK